MSSMAKGFSLGMTTVAVAVVFLVAFAWVGPGQNALFSTQPASALFDEDLVEGIYERVSPAVVEVDTGNGIGVDLVPLGKGSGFLIDAEGHIVTNNHVVDGVGSVIVTFSNGVSEQATILGRDIANDLALLKVEPSVVEGIEPVVLGDSSSLRPGQLAVAIGNPFGLEGSITVGVVSQVGRTLPTDLRRPISGVIQTALINPGNSGGPLLDSSGGRHRNQHSHSGVSVWRTAGNRLCCSRGYPQERLASADGGSDSKASVAGHRSGSCRRQSGGAPGAACR